jgi:hypothetical protein
MKVIFSLWTGPKKNKNPDKRFFRAMAATSNFLAQKCGYETVLYTDNVGREALSKINYNNVISLPEETLNKFPTSVWSMGKILTASLINEPFIHIDFDLFLKAPLNQELLSKEAIFFHHEIWMDRLLADTSFLIKRRPENLKDNNSVRSYNCGIFGGTNYTAFNEVCKEICDIAIKNSDFLNKMNDQQNKLKAKKLVRHGLHLPMLFEQLWIPQLLKNKGVNIHTVLKNTKMEKYEEINYAENYNPANFLSHSEAEWENIKMENTKYLRLLQAESAKMNILHLYTISRTPENKQQILDFVRKNRVKH